MALGRLKQRAEFLKVAGARRKWAAPGLVLQAAPRGTDGELDIRIGYTASRKVGNAVARNRARRRLRAAVAQVMPRYAEPGFDYVVIARRGTVDRPFDALVGDLRHGLERLGACRSGGTDGEA